MTGAARRRRGANAERAVVTWLRHNGWPDARRYLAGDGRQPGDIDAIPGVCIEVKDRAESRWPTWLRQAVAEAGPHRIAAVVRRTRGVPDVARWECRWADTNATDRDVDLDAFIPGTFGEFIAWLQEETP